jgi:hypothetical protein
MVAPKFRGNPHPNAERWNVLKPIDGKTWLDAYYRSSDTFLRGQATAMGIILVTLVRKHRLWNDDGGTAGEFEGLIDCYSGSGSGDRGYALYDRAGTTRSNAESGYLEVQTRLAGPGGQWTADAVTTDGFSNPWHSQIDGGVELFGLSIKDDPYSEDEGGFVNGRKHEAVGISGLPILDGTVSSSNLFLMRHSGNTGMYNGRQSSRYLIGMAWHEDPLSEEEHFLLRQEVELARDIPEVPAINGAPVLDYIWSVKRHMAVGTGNAPATWNSDGASPSKSFSLQGSASDLEVLQLGADFTSR